MVKFACAKAHVVAAISDTTAKAASRLLRIEPERIVVVPNPVDARYRPAPALEVEQFRRRFALPCNFWLYVAHPYAHKNHSRLLAAYRCFRNQGGCSWPLVLRADRKAEWAQVEQAIGELGLDGDVLWLPRLSVSDMARLYTAATALVFPSLYEGCGMPVVEAMACGCPVAASDIPTTREFGGSAVWHFDPHSVEAITDAMWRMSADLTLRERCRVAGFEQAGMYSQEAAVAGLMQAYRRAKTD
jgi:glycosyltransferase involved in cell wall biosynthesis